MLKEREPPPPPEMNSALLVMLKPQHVALLCESESESELQGADPQGAPVDACPSSTGPRGQVEAAHSRCVPPPPRV
eukprot:360719-Chlamydomonas_euryale.AAC.19